LAGGSSVIVITSPQAFLEHDAEGGKSFEGLGGHFTRSADPGNERRDVRMHVVVDALDCRSLAGRQHPAHGIEADEIGEAVILAVRPLQAINSLGLVQGFKSLQMPYQLSQDRRVEQPLPPPDLPGHDDHGPLGCSKSHHRRIGIATRQ
jgi:hypothetical protein